MVGIVVASLAAAHPSTVHSARLTRRAAFSSVSSTGCGWAQRSGDSNGRLFIGRTQRTYILHIPVGYTGRTPLPLILNLHGSYMTASEQAAVSGMSRSADHDHIVVVYPQALTRHGTLTWAAEDEPYLNTLVPALERRVCLDTRRLAVTGLSAGGYMAYALACSGKAGAWIDVIAPVAAAMSTPQRACRLAHRIPLLAFHGTGDPLVWYRMAWPTWSPIPTMIANWARANGCAGPAQQVWSHGDTMEQSYGLCPRGMAVDLYIVANGGHQWPGGLPLFGLGRTTQSISASALIDHFVLTHGTNLLAAE